MTLPSNNFVINPFLLDIPGEVPIGGLGNGAMKSTFPWVLSSQGTITEFQDILVNEVI